VYIVTVIAYTPADALSRWCSQLPSPKVEKKQRGEGIIETR